MAMSQLSIVFLLAVGALAGVGLFAPVRPEASVVLGYLGAAMWGVGGLAAFSVHSQAWEGTKSMTPLAVVAIGVAMLLALLSTLKLAKAVQSSTGSSAATAFRRT